MSLSRFKLPVLLCVALLHGLGWAQALHDPMSPPASVAVPMTGQLEKPFDAGASQAVLIRKLGSVGKVTPGSVAEQAKPWRVVRITADSVVLQSSAGSRSIPAQPFVKKNVNSGIAPASPAKNGKP